MIVIERFPDIWFVGSQACISPMDWGGLIFSYWRYGNSAGIAARYKGRPWMLMKVIIQVQRIILAFSTSVVAVIARETEIPQTETYSFITFHAPTGEYIIRMCKNAPRHIKGAREIVKALEEFLQIRIREITEDNRFALEYYYCLGICEISPAVMINDKTYGNLTPDSARSIVKMYIRKEVEEIILRHEELKSYMTTSDGSGMMSSGKDLPTTYLEKDREINTDDVALRSWGKTGTVVRYCFYLIIIRLLYDCLECILSERHHAHRAVDIQRDIAVGDIPQFPSPLPRQKDGCR
ncbi:NAD(P)H-dependent oxidoreductase subunit E [Enterocloster asparagiformis]|uniref:NADH-quinone oxidoreductase subunit NuoE family protein n=1 Tax=Enterocloster asparagiformis TaxID=333367 RepID=UPI002A8309A7|nr:NAD(P)H-dependent oxidoreductase subunit E [Enterocloster asparagiformis]